MRLKPRSENHSKKNHSKKQAKDRLTRAVLSVMAVMMILALGAAAGCDKPREADCKKAIANIRKLYGTAGNEYGVSPRAMVRSCRGSASPKSVQCFIRAKSIEELQNCESGVFDKLFTGDKQAGDKQAGDTKPDPGNAPAPDNAGGGENSDVK